MTKPKISIISINFHQPQITCDLLDSLCGIEDTHYEVLLVDNGMEEDLTSRYQQHHKQVKVINSKENLGFAGGNNLAIKEAKGDYVLLLNNDTIVPPHFLKAMVEVLDTKPKVGIVSPKIYFYDTPNMLQYAGTSSINYKTGRGEDEAKFAEDKGQFEQSKKVALAHGACMMVRRGVFEQVGLLSEDYFLYYEELDFCERAKRSGWDIYYTADSYIHHRESSSVGKSSVLKTYYMFRNRWLFVRKFGGKNYWSFVAYFLLVSIPLNFLRFSLKGEWKHIKAIMKGLIWNLYRRDSPRRNTYL